MAGRYKSNFFVLWMIKSFKVNNGVVKKTFYRIST